MEDSTRTSSLGRVFAKHWDKVLSLLAISISIYTAWLSSERSTTLDAAQITCSAIYIEDDEGPIAVLNRSPQGNPQMRLGNQSGPSVALMVKPNEFAKVVVYGATTGRFAQLNATSSDAGHAAGVLVKNEVEATGSVASIEVDDLGNAKFEAGSTRNGHYMVGSGMYSDVEKGTIYRRPNGDAGSAGDSVDQQGILWLP